MPHAIIRGANGRRHEVDFGDAPVRVQIYASDETVEIFIEADFETLPEERRRFELLNLPRHLFSETTGAAARHAMKPRPASSMAEKSRHSSQFLALCGLVFRIPALCARSPRTAPWWPFRSDPDGTPWMLTRYGGAL